MKEKGQTNLSIGINATEYTNGFELQGAYGLTDKIALQLNADWVNSADDMEYNSSGKGNIIEFGGGYYKKISKSFVFETYGLIAFGKTQYEQTSEGTGEYAYVKTHFTRFGAQPSISFSSKYFNASLSTRLANVNYNNISGNYPFYSAENTYTYITEADYLKDNNSQWVAEPAITLQGGLEKVKLQLQYTLSYNLGDQYFYENYQEWDMISLGLKVEFPTKKNVAKLDETNSEQNNNP
ncbi:hypothetical protein FEDK69T_06880 [Flavobacterium enshiense DK69]|uniref:Outer membrane protein beta-barrel domain-containing protein n=2 Tax=Flavobacterium TaxID=237 RepID=V6SC58_9FLAO|nr:hypothetical protein [Flavobacterium enshiense]ESU24248.1 hypothetical protein FEDK69T_06880 [Flavobacterium enshiense DK69]KGO95378.1 hypothetical protein Q767_11260 [Flavobacterium enshiense DK69]